jgi:seryl-tRNA synthetase
MSEHREATPDQAEFLEQLIAARLLVPSGVPGVYGRGGDFEDVRLALEALVARSADDDPWERIAFPPVLPKRHLEDVGYLKSFPHLAGSIFSFDGSESEALAQEERASRHDDWSEFQQPTDLVLMPAACYPVYPAIAARGPLPDGGVAIDAGGGYVFRNEPSGDPARLQMFHQREMVRIGEPEVVQEWRERWRDRAIDLLRGLGLDASFDVASDPFFGRSGRMLAASQREQALKFEVLVQIAGPEPTACASFNYHQDHFSSTFGIRMADGTAAHTACLGFGEERVVLALFKTHGVDVGAWPDEVRGRLWETVPV